MVHTANHDSFTVNFTGSTSLSSLDKDWGKSPGSGSRPRVGIIFECTQNCLFHNLLNLLLMSRTAVIELVDNNNNNVWLLVAQYLFEMSTFFGKIMFTNVFYDSKHCKSIKCCFLTFWVENNISWKNDIWIFICF